MTRDSFRWWPAVAWYGLILTLTLPPRVGPDLPGIPHVDKVAHFCAFAGQAYWICFGFLGGTAGRKARSATKNFLRATLALALVLGALDEFLQYFTPGRSCELLDWLADAAGAGVVVWWFWKRNVRHGTVWGAPIAGMEIDEKVSGN